MVSAWLLACLMAAPAAAPAPVAVDRRDPAAVVRAYAEALARHDLATLTALLLPNPQAPRLLREFDDAHPCSPAELAQALLLPVGLRPVVGAAAVVTDGTAQVELTGRLEPHPKVVLRRQADGTWAVDLSASLLATANGQTDVLTRYLSREPAGPPPPPAAADQPEVRQAKEACLDHQRQLAGALNTYADEHHGKYPLAAVWMDALAPYLDGEQVFGCPAHPQEHYSYAFCAAMSERPRPPLVAASQPLLLACTGQDTANALFTEDDLARLPARHGRDHLWSDTAGSRATPATLRPSDVLAGYERGEQCRAKLVRLQTAARQYAKAHGGRLPAAATWCTALAPLVERPADGTSPFVCPAAEGAECTYAMCRELAEQKLSDLVGWRRLTLFIETEPGPLNATVPAATKPARRHHSLGMDYSQTGGYRVALAGEPLLAANR